MRKMISILVVTMAMVAGCATHATTPAARATAARLYAEGKSCGEIAQALEVDREHARELIRTGMADLNRKFYKERN